MSDVIIAGRGHCCDPFAVLKQEIDMAVTIAMNARNIADQALASASAISVNAMKYKGTVGTGGTIPSLPAADPDNQGDTYIAISSGISPVTYDTGDVLISNGSVWNVVPSGDDIVPIVTSWQATPDDAHVPSEKLVKDSLDSKQDTLISGTNIKTINNTSLLGSGNIAIGGGPSDYVKLDRWDWEKYDPNTSQAIYDFSAILETKDGYTVAKTDFYFLYSRIYGCNQIISYPKGFIFGYDTEFSLIIEYMTLFYISGGTELHYEKAIKYISLTSANSTPINLSHIDGGTSREFVLANDYYDPSNPMFAQAPQELNLSSYVHMVSIADDIYYRPTS